MFYRLNRAGMYAGTAAGASLRFSYDGMFAVLCGLQGYDPFRAGGHASTASGTPFGVNERNALSVLGDHWGKAPAASIP
jgi:hypothetical protein